MPPSLSKSPKVAICRISQKISVTIQYVLKFIAQHGHKLKSCIDDTNVCGHGIVWRVRWCYWHRRSALILMYRRVLYVNSIIVSKIKLLHTECENFL